MVFIKLENVVFHTNPLNSLNVDNQTSLAEKYLSVLIATAEFQLCQRNRIDQSFYPCQSVEFSKLKPQIIPDYLTDFPNVIDILPQYLDVIHCLDFFHDHPVIHLLQNAKIPMI
jgi:hypothetical protein